MAVFPHHTRANECCQLAGHAASRVVPGTLQDHRAFPCNGILQDLAASYGSAIRRAVRVGVRHSRPSLASGMFGLQLLPNPIREELLVTRCTSDAGRSIEMTVCATALA